MHNFRFLLEYNSGLIQKYDKNQPDSDMYNPEVTH